MEELCPQLTLVRTALYDEHVALDANIVDFQGFELPIWYSNIKDEHLATREGTEPIRCQSHGNIPIYWFKVKQWLEGVATQKVTNIPTGRCAYTHFLDEAGFIIDDMIFAVVSDDEILGVPNASMIDVMWEWFQGNLPSDGSVKIENLSPDMSIIALQGPKSKQILSAVLGMDNHVGRFKWQNIENQLSVSGWIQGTGYTGEPGYEIFIPNDDAANLWRSLIDSGATPVGLGARDTLRLEKGYLLVEWTSVGQELPESTSYWHRFTGNKCLFGLDLDHDFIWQA